MSVLEKPFVFVIGAPRSGTSWLHQMLAAHPQVAAMGSEELTVFSRYLAPWASNFELETRNRDEGKWAQGLPCLFSAAEFEQQMRAFVDHVYTRLQARNPDATHLLDKHPNYSNHLPLIDRLLPQSRVLHIIRDGREVAVSMMSVRKRIGHSPGEVRGAAQEWHRCIRGAQAYASTLGPARYLEVRYEDLQQNTAVRLREIMAFCDLPASDELVERIAKEHNINVRQVSTGDASLNALRGQPGRIWQEKMSARERWIFDRMAGNLLHELGYAQPGWWALSSADRLRLLPYGFTAKAKRSLTALKNVWAAPVEERLS
jgi:hypothetical protein